jgi:arylamine N-acetyltransferase
VKENVEIDSNTPSTPLTPEQKSRIEQNKLAARARLATKTSNGLLVDVGSSWFTALESEFSKQYFTDVSTCINKVKTAKSTPCCQGLRIVEDSYECMYYFLFTTHQYKPLCLYTTHECIPLCLYMHHS